MQWDITDKNRGKKQKWYVEFGERITCNWPRLQNTKHWILAAKRREYWRDSEYSDV